MTDDATLRSSKPERRRRKDFRPAEILDAAFREFAEKGFRGTRLEDVAARAGVVKGTIYLYYANKTALFEAAVRSRMLPMVDRVQAMAERHDGSAADMLRFMFRMIYERLSDPDVRTVLRILIADGQDFPELLKFYHAMFVSKMIGVLGAVIKRGVERGEFRATALGEVPQVVMAPALMGAIWQMTFAPYQPATLDQFMSAHAELVLDGLLKRD